MARLTIAAITGIGLLAIATGIALISAIVASFFAPTQLVATKLASPQREIACERVWLNLSDELDTQATLALSPGSAPHRRKTWLAFYPDFGSRLRQGEANCPKLERGFQQLDVLAEHYHQVVKRLLDEIDPRRHRLREFAERFSDL